MTATLPPLAKLKPNPHWAKLPLFSRKNWSRFRFGEVVENVNERVEPSTAAEEIYVGLDDLDSSSLHIRRWGNGPCSRGDAGGLHPQGCLRAFLLHRNRQVKVTTAVLAGLNMLCVRQGREHSNRHANMAAATDLVPHDGDSLLASSGKAIVVEKHGCRDLGAELFDLQCLAA